MAESGSGISVLHRNFAAIAALAGSRSRSLSVGAQVALAAAAHLLLWGGALALIRHAPALDSAEQLVWSYALQGGYWKHPPLVSWLMSALVGVFGPSVALPAIAAQGCVVVALMLTWRLGCAFLAPGASLLAMGLSSLVVYHNLGAEPFNHNTVLLPFQAAATLLFFRAVRTGGWWRWALAGAFAGLALLVKYIALFPLAALLLYFVLDRACWTRRNLLGLALAGAVLALVTAPHAWWLWTHNFPTLRYARAVAIPHSGALLWLTGLSRFLLEQALRLLPMLCVLFWLLRRGSQQPSPPTAAARDRLFLYVAGLAPLGMMLLYGLATGTVLLPRWGSNAFLLAGWLVLDLLRGRGLPAPGAALRGIAAAHLALCAIGVVLLPLLGEAFTTYGRSQFPGAALSEHAQRTWHAHHDVPLRLVISDAWTGGNLAAHQPSPLAVLLDGTFGQAPWITAADVAACGALVLVNHGEFRAGQAPPRLAARLAEAPLRGEWLLPWATHLVAADTAKGTHIDWGIIPPAADGNCRL